MGNQPSPLPAHKLGLSIKEMAEAIGVCGRTVINAINAGELRVVHVGRRVIIPRAAAEKFLERDRRLTASVKGKKA